MSFQYTVSVGPSATGPWTQFNVTASTTDTITGLAAGTSYFVQIIVTDTVTGLSSTPLVSGPFATAALPGESAPGTTSVSTSQIIYSSQTPGTAAAQGATLDTWTLSSAPGPTCEVVHNGVADTTTNSLVELFYTGHFLYQEATNTNSLTPPGGTTGWWQWNPSSSSAFNGWVEVASPVPTTPTIGFNQIANQSLNTPFAISGVLQNYTSTPTLTYNDNGGSYGTLPSGASVTKTSFSFTHPGITAVGSADTVGLKDASGNTGISNSFTVSTPIITGITLSQNSFAAATAPPVTVGTITVQFSGGQFTGTLSLTGANASSFTINGNQLQTAANLAAGNYNINIVATQSGASGSPFTQAETLTASTGPSVGPAASGSFINIDFTNLNSPANVSGVIVHPQLFGVSSSGISNNVNGAPFGVCNSSTFQQLVTALAPPLFRLHSGWTSVYNSNGQLVAYAPQSNLQALAANASKIFPSNCTILLGGWYNNSLGGSVSDQQEYANLASYWASNGTLPSNLFEVGNETGQSPASYQSSFNTAVAGIQSVNSSYRLGGPAYAGNPGQSWWNSFISVNSANTVGFLSWHEYEYCVPNRTPTDTECCSAYSAGTTSIFSASDILNIQGSTSGKYAAGLPLFLGEYSIECSADSDFRMGSSIAVPFLMNTLLGAAAVSTQPVWGGIWDLVNDGGDNYNLITSGLQTLPSYYGLQQLILRMPGAMVNSNNSRGCNSYATKNGSNFGVAIANTNGTQVSNVQVALSHWPLNSSGNATIHMWSYPTSPGLSSGGTDTSVGTVVNTPGTVTTVAVTAGLTAPINIPAYSGVILYP